MSFLIFSIKHQFVIVLFIQAILITNGQDFNCRVRNTNWDLVCTGKYSPYLKMKYGDGMIRSSGLYSIHKLSDSTYPNPVLFVGHYESPLTFCHQFKMFNRANYECLDKSKRIVLDKTTFREQYCLAHRFGLVTELYLNCSTFYTKLKEHGTYFHVSGSMMHYNYGAEYSAIGLVLHQNNYIILICLILTINV